MKQSILKRTLLTACLGVSMASVAMAGPVGPVVIPQAGDVVVINHGPDMTFTGISILMWKAKLTTIYKLALL